MSPYYLQILINTDIKNNFIKYFLFNAGQPTKFNYVHTSIIVIVITLLFATPTVFLLLKARREKVSITLKTVVTICNKYFSENQRPNSQNII